LSSRLLSKNVKIRIYKTIILPVVLYGCETWFLTLREEDRWRVFENRVLKRIFVPKRDDISRACSTNGEKMNAYKILVGKPDGKRPLGRPRRRWGIILKWIIKK
jgi:hypothetical protein